MIANNFPLNGPNVYSLKSKIFFKLQFMKNLKNQKFLIYPYLTEGAPAVGEVKVLIFFF